MSPFQHVCHVDRHWLTGIQLAQLTWIHVRVLHLLRRRALHAEARKIFTFAGTLPFA